MNNNFPSVGISPYEEHATLEVAQDSAGNQMITSQSAELAHTKGQLFYYKTLASQLKGQLKIKQMRIDELTKSND